jgi:hypothetical protein
MKVVGNSIVQVAIDLSTGLLKPLPEPQEGK